MTVPKGFCACCVCWSGLISLHCKASAAWHVRSVHGRLYVNNRFAASVVTCAFSQLRTSSERESKFVGNKTAIYSWNRSSVCLLFVKLALLCVFSSFIRPITKARASWEHAFDDKWQRQARDTAETAVRRCERSTKEPIATNRSIAKDSWASCGYAKLNCVILSKYELLRASACRQFTSARCQIETGLFFRSNLCPIFAQSLPGHSLGVCLPPGPWIFSSEMTSTDKKWKLVPNARLPR